MLDRHKIAVAFVTLCFLTPLQLSGQSCTAATCNAATANRADVLAALPSPSNTNATVVVNIPSGTGTWTTGFSYTIPSAVTNLTIQGNTAVNCTGTAGTSSYICTATDNTVIKDQYASNNALMVFSIGNSAFRITGLTMQGGTLAGGNSKYNGLVQSYGNGGTFRYDHNHCNLETYSPAYANSSVCWKNGPSTVVAPAQNIRQLVADHNLVDLASTNTQIEAGFSNYLPYNDTIGLGDGNFAQATPWGQLDGVMYVESNVFNGGAPNDVGFGSSQVMRYNTINNSYVGIQTHGTKSQGGPSRGARSIEGYHNYFVCPSCSPASALIGTKGAAALYWGNTVSGQPAYHFYQGGGDRQSGDETETAPPQGWGYCGTTVNSNGTGSCWDGNQGGSGTCSQGGSASFPTPTGSGYPCLDGLGRGQDQQHLNGQLFNNSYLSGRLNTATNSISWSKQYLEPQYLWMNTLGGIASSNYMLLNDGSVNNKDYYYDQTAQSGSFTGAAGTGYGLLSARPSTCTAGPGGTFGASPTGSYGVAYWATDANSGNGELYVCSATNTWTGIYQPATYPHPLVTGGTNYTWTLTVVGSGTVTGTNSNSGTYASGTTIGPLTATPAAGNTFSGWSSVTGSASCSGNPTSSFALTANSGCTATFTGTTYTLTVSTAGGGTGTVSGTNCTTGTYASGTTVTCTASPSAGSAFLGWSGACVGTGSCSFNLSANSTVTATFGLTAAQPTFSPAAGSFASAQTVTISSATSGATIYYTTDGSIPDHTSSVYSTPITVSTSQTVNAIAAKTGYGDSPPGTAVYVINGTLSPPTLSPPGGAYGPAQTITLSAPGGQAAVIAATMTETSNAAASTGAAVHRNTYTNCATGYSGGVLQPAGYPVGNLYCTSSDKTTAVANGGPNNGVVVSNITGTGTTALDNGHNAGGTDSAPSVTATYGGTASGGCPVGTNVASTVVSGLTLLGAVSNANAVFGATSASSGHNTSMLTVSKYNISADAGNYYYREDCQKPNTTSVSGEHFEWDTNYASTDGSYFGWGIHYNFSDSKFYYCPQGCSSWKAMTLTPVGGGTALSTYSWPANNSLYSQFYLHRTLSCSYSSGSNCAFYDMLCLRLYDAAGSPVNSLTCYNLKDATSGQTPSFIPQNKTSWTHPQFGPQHQIDINGASANITNTVAFDNLGAYSLTIGTSHICYTTDGTDPTGDTTGACTHGTLYSAPFTVSVTTTVKAITVQSAFNPSAVSSETYTINGAVAQPTFSPVAGSYTSAQLVTISDATAGSTLCYTLDGSTPTGDGNGNCTHGTTYTGPVLVATSATLQAIGTKSGGFSDSTIGSAAYVITIPPTAPTSVRVGVTLRTGVTIP